MTKKCTIISQMITLIQHVIICEIILHLLVIVQGDHKVSVHLTITVQKNTQKYSNLNSFNHLLWTVLY